MIYIHVPFCRTFCIYCSFYSEICAGSGSSELRARYVRALVSEAEERAAEIATVRLSGMDSLYIGGGTPSLLDMGSLGEMVGALGARPEGEFTIEVNPDDIVEKGEEYARGLVGLGVNRVSMGVQSFDDGILGWMRRRHDAQTAVEAFGILRRAGVENISIDLMFGMSRLTDALWIDTIDKAVSLHPEHISAYQLSVEEGSVLYGMVGRGEYKEASDSRCARQYAMLCDRLRKAGYLHYEISNWALPGYEARHNSAYWTRVPYVGLGPGAHSFDGRRRSWNTESVDAYVRESETLTAVDDKVETIMLALRTAAGIDADYLKSCCDHRLLDSLIAEGSLVRVDSPLSGCRLRIPEDRFFVSDDIIRRLI